MLIFQVYRLQGAVWTALGEDDGVAILPKYLIFRILDHNFFSFFFFFFFVTKELRPSHWSCIYISTLKLSFPYIGMSQFDIWWMSIFFSQLVGVTFMFISVMYQLSCSGLYILIYLILIISDRRAKNTFFCYLVTVVVRLIYIDISTVTLEGILIYPSDVYRKTLLLSQCCL